MQSLDADSPETDPPAASASTFRDILAGLEKSFLNSPEPLMFQFRGAVEGIWGDIL